MRTFLRCCRHVQDDEFVCPLRFVSRRSFGGIPRVAEALEAHALHDPATAHVEARNDATCQHGLFSGAVPRVWGGVARAAIGLDWFAAL